jgi:hypothetical protein
MGRTSIPHLFGTKFSQMSAYIEVIPFMSASKQTPCEDHRLPPPTRNKRNVCTMPDKILDCSLILNKILAASLLGPYLK